MIGLSSVKSTAQYSLLASLLTPDTLYIKLILHNQNTNNLVTKQVSNREIESSFAGLVNNVSELYRILLNSQDYEVVLEPNYEIRFAFFQPKQCTINFTLKEQKALPQTAQKDKNKQLENYDQDAICEKVAEKILMRLIEDPHVGKQIMTRSQQKIGKVYQQIRQFQNKIEEQLGQIEKLKRTHKYLKEEVKALKTQLKKSESQPKNVPCNCSKQIEELNRQLKSLKEKIAGFSGKNEDTHTNQIQKGSKPRKMTALQARNLHVPAKINRQPVAQSSLPSLLSVNQLSLQYKNFKVSGNSIRLIKDNSSPVNATDPKQAWKYFYFDNVIPYKSGFLLHFIVRKCKDSNIAIGVVEQKYSQKTNCFNAYTCIQYVGLSKIIFESGVERLRCHGTITTGDEIAVKVIPSDGRFMLKKFASVIVEYESNKLRDEDTRYVFFIRMKDVGDTIQIISPMRPMRKKVPDEDQPAIPQEYLRQ